VGHKKRARTSEPFGKNNFRIELLAVENSRCNRSSPAGKRGEIPLFEGKAQVVGGRKFAGQKPLR